MSYGTKQLRAYKIELPFYEQPKKLKGHYTSLIEPLLKEDYANEQAKQNLIDLYRDTINLTIEAIKDEFEMEVTSGELISVILQHPYFQSRWLSPRYCRDYGDCPLSFQDFFAGAVQNGIKPKWAEELIIPNYVMLGMKKGRFETTDELKYFIEKDLLPNPKLFGCSLYKEVAVVTPRKSKGTTTNSIAEKLAMRSALKRKKNILKTCSPQSSRSIYLDGQMVSEHAEPKQSKLRKGFSSKPFFSVSAETRKNDKEEVKGSDHKLLKRTTSKRY